MIKLPRDTELTLPLLQRLLDEHTHEVNNRYKALKDALESDHEIKHLPKKPAYKPDNRIVCNFARYIVETFNGFFIGNPVKVVAEDSAVADYVEFLDAYNDQDDNNAELARLMSTFGKAYEMYFTDEESEQCITYLSPMEAFMVKDDSVLERPLFFVRRYTDWEGNEYGSVFDSKWERRFKHTGGLQWIDEDWAEHRYDGVPATEYIENAEEQGIFEPVLSNINAYNKAISEKANDVDYFADAYMKVLGVALDEEGIQHIRDNRIINFEGDDAGKIVVEFMGKPESDTAQENLLNRLERLIFQNSMVANISDENFGTSSGIALKYKLLAMNNLVKTKIRKFTSGMNRRYKLLFGHPASKVPKDAWMQLEYQFTPNLPANLLEEAQIAAQMEGITSHHTQLKILSAVDDVEEELERIEEENEPDEETVVDRMMFPPQTEQPEADSEEEEPEEGVMDDQ